MVINASSEESTEKSHLVFPEELGSPSLLVTGGLPRFLLSHQSMGGSHRSMEVAQHGSSEADTGGQVLKKGTSVFWPTSSALRNPAHLGSDRAVLRKHTPILKTTILMPVPHLFIADPPFSEQTPYVPFTRCQQIRDTRTSPQHLKQMDSPQTWSK